MLRVQEIWRYPVKSVGGERVSPSAELTDLGIVGDRGWGIFDVDTGTVLTARRTPDLLFASARLVESAGDDLAVEMTLPDNSVVASTDAGADAALSTWLNRPVELRRAGAEGGTYEVPLDFENDDQWVSWEGPGKAWHDSRRSRVSLVSTESLGSWDARRFRTNIICEGSGEDDLVGQTVGLGSTSLELTKHIDRCVVVTRPQPGLERDLDVLRTINNDRATLLSIGALVATEGTISEGDTLAT